MTIKIGLINFGHLFLSVKVRQGIRRDGQVLTDFAIGTDGAGLWGSIEQNYVCIKDNKVDKKLRKVKIMDKSMIYVKS